MASNKITEKPQVAELSPAASLLVTQQEAINGVPTEALRRATLETLANALKAKGINDGLMSTQTFESLKHEIISSIESSEDGLKVTFADGGETTIAVAASGLAFETMSFTDGYLHLLDGNGEDVIDPCFIGGGGGGGSGTGSSMRILNGMSGRSLTVMSTAAAYLLLYSWTSIDTDTNDPTGNGSAAWFVNNIRVATQNNLTQGSQSFDIRRYLQVGTANSVKLVIDDAYGSQKAFTWTVTCTNISLSWNVNDDGAMSGIGFHGSDSLTLRLTPSGVGSKDIYVELDGEQFTKLTTTASGRALNVAIPAQTHGAHFIRAWMEILVDGELVSTPAMTHTGIWTEAGNNSCIISLESSAITVRQMENAMVRYRVYDPASETSEVSLYIGNTLHQTLTISRDTQTWSYAPRDVGEHELTIVSGSARATVTITAEALGVSVQPVEDAVLTVNPAGHTNAEVTRANFGYTDADGVNHPFGYSANFDWVNGGFQIDDENVTAFVIKRGTYVELDRSLFSDNAKATGKEIKIVYKAVNPRVPNAGIFDCVSGGVGISAKANGITFSSALESLDYPLAENRKIEADINIESAGEHSLATLWLKGIPSGGFVYTDGDTWTQDAPKNMRIGSEETDVWLYLLRMYTNSLTIREIIQNYAADCPVVDEMLDRYRRNDIYGDNDRVNMEKLADARPDLYVINLSVTRMTTGKKDKVTSKISFIQRSGGAAHNFIATGAKHMAQGTSSLDYIMAALNLDIDFSSCTSWLDADGNEITSIALTQNSIPVAYLNIKLNVASSENSNNVCLAELYNKFQPYKSAARLADSRVRDTVEGHPCAVFITNDSDTEFEAGSQIVAPGETIFYGAGDLNNSKKNSAVFGHDRETWPESMCLEITNNNNDQCLFRSDDLSTETWGESDDDEAYCSFEPRYPSALTSDDKAKVQALLTWVVSTDRSAATNEQLTAPVTYGETVYTHDNADYRAAKFKHEVGNWFAVDSLVYHYLFTEFFCMVDNRAKNTFMSYEYDAEQEKYLWNFCRDYDNDTAMGNDNSGGLTFTYGLEDSDSVNGAKAFNASDSVLWCNVRDVLKDELIAMYRRMESVGDNNENLWSAKTLSAFFKAYQSNRPEALMAEDAWNKYVMPYISNGETRYLEMMCGSKEYQRDQFLECQSIYENTHYVSSSATSDSIEFRSMTNVDNWAGVQPSGDIVVTPYTDMYIVVRYGNVGTVKVRAKGGVRQSITCPTNNLNDTETYIYGASNVSELDGLAALYTRLAILARATRLQTLKLGSGEAGYHNDRLTTISFGSNVLLEEVDLRGTPNLAQSLDLTGLKNLKTILATNSGLTGAEFADGAPVETAHLPMLTSLTMKNLSLLTDFMVTSGNMSRIWIDNTPVDSASIVQNAPNLLRGRLTGVNWTLQNADILLRLARIGGFDSTGENVATFVLEGECYIQYASQAELSTIAIAFQNLSVRYGELLQEYTVTFYDEDGATVLHTQQVRKYGAAVNPVTAGLIPAPVKASTIEESFSFIGWDVSFSYVTGDMSVCARYSSVTRTYTVKHWNGAVLLKTQTVDAHGSAPYDGDDPTDPNGLLWMGWDKPTGNVTSNMDVYAVFAQPKQPDAVATGYEYLYSDDPADNSAYTINEIFWILTQKRAREYFQLGDRIKIVPNTNVFADSKIILSLHDFRHYKLADDSGEWAETCFYMIGVMNSTRQVHNSNTNVGGFFDKNLDVWLNGPLLNALPQWVKGLAKLVQVKTSAGNTSNKIVTANRKILLMSYAEVGFAVNDVPYKNEVEVEPGIGHVTFPCYTDNSSRIKKTYNGEGSASNWWLRSPYASIATSFMTVGSTGTANGANATISYSVAFGFCL